MESNSAILTALLVVLVVAVVFQCAGGWKKAAGGCDGFAAGPEPNPYVALHKRIDAVRGRGPAQGRPDAGPRHLTPEQITEAEREQWYAAAEADHAAGFNTELAHDAAADTMQYHSAAPALDYNSHITDLIVDDRMKDNHRRWATEMKPWSGTAMRVDDLEPENYVHFHGLRRPQPVAVHNPLQLTEVGPDDYAGNPKFNFRG